MQIKYRTKNGKNEYLSIYVRFWDSNRIDTETVTGLKVKKIDWSEKKQLVRDRANIKQKDFVNNHLRDLRSTIFENYNIDYNNKAYVGKNWLKEQVNAYFGRTNENESHKIYFIDWIVRFIENAPNRIYKGKKISPDTIKNYSTALKTLKDFEKHKKIKLRFEDIDLKFYNEFVSYCITEKKFTNNTTGSAIGKIKLFCRQIELENLPINPQFKHPEFMSISNSTKDIYLNEKEINQIFTHIFKLDYLSNARDLFIIGLRTGLRVSDFLHLQNINLQKGYIEITTKKTGEAVVIPLHNQIRAIIERNNGELPRTISDQRFNEYIKEVCKTVGISELVEGGKMNPKTKRKEYGRFPKHELVASHTCRRSFASNLYGELPNGVIMSITGHKTESQFLKYVKITKQENAETLKRYWAKEQEQKGYTNVLRAVK